MVLDSIWRIRSRVTPVHLADLIQRLWAARRSARNRIDTTPPASRSDKRVQHRMQLLPCSNVKLTASAGLDRLGVLDQVHRTRCRRPPPSGVCSEIGSRPYFCTSINLLRGHVQLKPPASSGVGLAAQVLQHLPLQPGASLLITLGPCAPGSGWCGA